MRDYNLAKAGMPGWRDVIGHNVFDNHPHMRFAVEENMQAQVINHFTRLTNAYDGLLNQFTVFMAALAAGEEPVADARAELAISAHIFISKLRSLRLIHAILYHRHVDENLPNYSLNVDGALMMWVLNPLR
ncbi:predicted protein [Arabidopsis lyrata subsp. lyrata]|uniref:Predicted protein n=1 Tax=Arabidopsis lyrata subsp. lyrata TaxID=81972 RepID=D7LXI8_ARALL|nr:predicted protein [Arabidopsis lyrata subsp. lyrata]